MQTCANNCRSPKTLENEYYFAEVGLDPAESEPLELGNPPHTALETRTYLRDPRTCAPSRTRQCTSAPPSARRPSCRHSWCFRGQAACFRSPAMKFRSLENILGVESFRIIRSVLDYQIIRWLSQFGSISSNFEKCFFWPSEVKFVMYFAILRVLL